MKIPRHKNWNLLGLVLFVAVLFGVFALQVSGNGCNERMQRPG